VFASPWHPRPTDPDAAYRNQPMTIAIFALTETGLAAKALV
jgi:hypothetical protein